VIPQAFMFEDKFARHGHQFLNGMCRCHDEMPLLVVEPLGSIGCLRSGPRHAARS
jgi:hypothetical protein